MRLTGICIANGFSSEVRVFSTHLRHSPGEPDATVICHDAPGMQELAPAVEAASGAHTLRTDTGYRFPPGRREARLLSKPYRWWLLRNRSASLQRAIAATKPDVIYSSQQRIDCAAATRAAIELNLPQIVHLHYNVGPWLGSLPLERLAACEHVITVSEFIRHQVLALGKAPDAVTAIHNTMEVSPTMPSVRQEVRAELGIPAEARVLAQVSRMDPFKGLEDTVEVFCRVASANPAAFLVMVGDGPLRSSLERSVQEAGLAGRARFTGSRSDVPRLLAAVDVFSHPSLNDPCPLAVMEASGAGLPVVAYASGGIPEIVRSGEMGLLVPTGDREALVTATRTLLDEPGIADRFGAAGSARIAEHFKPEEGGRQFSGVVEAVHRARLLRHAMPAC